MKVLLVSNRNQHFHNTNYYREKALIGLGHDVVFFNVFSYLTLGRLRAFFPVLQRAEDERINKMLVRACAEGRPDLCLVVGGHTILPDTVRQICALGVRVVLWTTDVPHPQRFANVLSSAALYDRVFCAGTEAIEVLGGRCAPVWLPFACDPICHAPQVLSPQEVVRYQRDIVFTGSYYSNRQHVLEALAAYDIGIWGPLWGRLPMASALKTKAEESRLDFSVWTKIYSAAKIVLVVHYQDGNIPCYQASPKLFEAMACGAFVLCDDQKDARALFQDKENVVFFKDADDLKQKVDFYLANPQERERIAACGRREVLEKHTYRHRMQKIIEVSVP
jgi:spore maturation protein CgeB